MLAGVSNEVPDPEMGFLVMEVVFVTLENFVFSILSSRKAYVKVLTLMFVGLLVLSVVVREFIWFGPPRNSGGGLIRSGQRQAAGAYKYTRRQSG